MKNSEIQGFLGGVRTLLQAKQNVHHRDIYLFEQKGFDLCSRLVCDCFNIANNSVKYQSSLSLETSSWLIYEPAKVHESTSTNKTEIAPRASFKHKSNTFSLWDLVFSVNGWRVCKRKMAEIQYYLSNIVLSVHRKL